MEKSEKGLSAGRVQSVAVKLITDREKEIQQFVPEEYWSITGTFLLGDEPFEAKFYGRNGKKESLTSEENVNEVLKQIKGKQFAVADVVKKNGAATLSRLLRRRRCSKKRQGS